MVSQGLCRHAVRACRPHAGALNEPRVQRGRRQATERNPGERRKKTFQAQRAALDPTAARSPVARPFRPSRINGVAHPGLWPPMAAAGLGWITRPRWAAG